MWPDPLYGTAVHMHVPRIVGVTFRTLDLIQPRSRPTRGSAFSSLPFLSISIYLACSMGSQQNRQ